MRRILMLASLCMGLTYGSHDTRAAVPQTLHYSGKLSTGGGHFTGTVDITFTLYADAKSSGGFWSENQAVTVDNGRFHVVLGTNTPIAATDVNVAALHLGVQVASDSEMAKVPIHSVPFALQSASALTLNGKTADELGGGKALASKVILDKFVSGHTTSTAEEEVASVEPSLAENRLTPTSIVVEGRTSINSSSNYTGVVFVRFHYADGTHSSHGNISFYGTNWTSKTLTIPIHAGFRGDITKISVMARRGWYANPMYNVYGQITVNGFETVQ